MDSFVGSWQVDASKDVNIDKLEDGEGIPQDKRELLKQAVRALKDNGNGTYTVEFKAGPVNKTHVMTPGQPLEIESPDGSKRKVVTTMDGNTMVEHIDIIGKGKSITVRNTREGNYMVAAVSLGSVNAKRYWKKI